MRQWSARVLKHFVVGSSLLPEDRALPGFFSSAGQYPDNAVTGTV